MSVFLMSVKANDDQDDSCENFLLSKKIDLHHDEITLHCTKTSINANIDNKLNRIGIEQ